MDKKVLITSIAFIVALTMIVIPITCNDGSDATDSTNSEKIFAERADVFFDSLLGENDVVNTTCTDASVTVTIDSSKFGGITINDSGLLGLTNALFSGSTIELNNNVVVNSGVINDANFSTEFTNAIEQILDNINNVTTTGTHDIFTSNSLEITIGTDTFTGTLVITMGFGTDMVNFIDYLNTFVTVDITSGLEITMEINGIDQTHITDTTTILDVLNEVYDLKTSKIFGSFEDKANAFFSMLSGAKKTMNSLSFIMGASDKLSVTNFAVDTSGTDGFHKFVGGIISHANTSPDGFDNGWDVFIKDIKTGDYYNALGDITLSYGSTPNNIVIPVTFSITFVNEVVFGTGVESVTVNGSNVETGTVISTGDVINITLADGYEIDNVQNATSSGASYTANGKGDVTILVKKTGSDTTIVPSYDGETAKIAEGYDTATPALEFEINDNASVYIERTDAAKTVLDVGGVAQKISVSLAPVPGETDVYELEILVNDVALIGDVVITVTLPCDTSKGIPVVYYDNEAGSLEAMSVVSYTATSVTFTTTHNSLYVINYVQESGDVIVVTLNPNGGSVSVTETNVSGNSYGYLPTPTRSGYDFNGWYYMGERVTSYSPLLTNQNHTLTAYWTYVGDYVPSENGSTNNIDAIAIGVAAVIVIALAALALLVFRRS